MIPKDEPENAETSATAAREGGIINPVTEPPPIPVHRPLCSMITDFVRRTAQTCKHNELVSAARRLATPVTKGAGGGEDAVSTAAADEQHITRILAREFQSFVLIMSKACRVLYADDEIVQELLGNVPGDGDNTSSQNVLPVTTLVGENLLHYVHAEDQAKSRIQLRQTLDETIHNSNGYNPSDFTGGKTAGMPPNNSKPFKLPSAIEPLCAFAVRLRSGVGAIPAVTTSSISSPMKTSYASGQFDGSKAKSEPQKFASSTSSSPALPHSSPTMWTQYHLCLLKGNWIKTNASSTTSFGGESGQNEPTPLSQDSKITSNWSKRLLQFLSTSNASYKELDYIWFGIVKVVKPNATIMSPNCFTMTLGLMPLPPGADPCGSGKNTTATAVENGSDNGGSNASTPGSNNGGNNNATTASHANRKESKKRMRSGGELSKSSKRNLSGENEFYGKLAILDVDQRCTCLTGYFASELCDTQFFYYINPYYIPLVVNNITKMILRESDICTCTVKMRNAYETNFSVDLLLTVTAQPNNLHGFGAIWPTPILFLNCVVSPTFELNVKTPGFLDSHSFHLEEIKRTCDARLYEAAYDSWNCWTNAVKLKTETKLAVLSGCLYKMYESVLASDNNSNEDADYVGNEPDPKRPRISSASSSSALRFYCTRDEHAFVPMPLISTRNDLSSPTAKFSGGFPGGSEGKPGERRASLHSANAGSGHPSRTGSLTGGDTNTTDNPEPNYFLFQQLVNGSGVFDDAVLRARMLEAANNNQYAPPPQQQQNYAATMLFGNSSNNNNFMQSQPMPATLPPNNATVIRPVKTSNLSPLPVLQQQQQQLPPKPEMKDRQLKELLSQPIDSEKRFRCNILGPTSTAAPPTTTTPTSASTTFTANNKKLLNGGAVTVPSPSQNNNNNNGNMAMMWGGNVSGGGLQHSQQQHGMPYGAATTTMVMTTADGNLYSTAPPPGGGANGMLTPRGGGQMVVMGHASVMGGGQPSQYITQHGGGGMFMTSGGGGGPQNMMGGGGQVSPNFSPSPGGGGIRNVRIMSPNNGQQQQQMLVRGGVPMNMRPMNAGTPVTMVTVSGHHQQAMMESDMRGQPPMYFAGGAPPPPGGAGGGPRFQPPYNASPVSPSSASKQQQQQQQNAPVRQLQQQLREKHQNLEQNLKIQDEDLARMKQDVIGVSQPFGGGSNVALVNRSSASGSGPPGNVAEFSSAVPVSSAAGGGAGDGAASPQQQQVVEKITRLQQRSSMQKQELGVLNVKLATASSNTGTPVGQQQTAPPTSSTSAPAAMANPAVSSSSSSMMPKLQSTNANMPPNTAGMPSFSSQDQAVVVMQTGRGGGPPPPSSQQQISYSSMPLQQQQQQRFVGPPPPVIGSGGGLQQPQDMSVSPQARRMPMMQRQMMNYGPESGIAPPQHRQHGGGIIMQNNSGSYVGGPQQQQQSNVFYSPQQQQSLPPNSSGGMLMESGGPGSAGVLDYTNDALFDDLFSTLEANTGGANGNGQNSSSNNNRQQMNFLNDFL